MAVRWQKEWIPLVSQQMRVRNLTQILAYNLHVEPSPERASFFYTLHLTSKSAPFYTSDQSTGPNPRWIEIDFKGKAGLSSSCLVIRIWQVGTPNRLVTTWGVCLSGLQLAPTDQDLSKISGPENIVFFIHGFRFVPPTNEQVVMRLASATVNANEAKLSYPVNQLRRLKTYQMQQARASATCESLRQEIHRVGPFPPSACPMQAAGNKYQYQQVAKLCENLRVKLKLLKEEKARKEAKIQELRNTAEQLAAKTELDTALLREDIKALEECTQFEQLKESVSKFKEEMSITWSELAARRHEMISQLKYIYPISILNSQDPEGLAKICGVKLLRSDELNNQDEASSSVALGFAAHATVMIAKFLDVPLRYPIQHAGSRAKIWDVVAPKLPDSEREFPLFLKGRESIHFYYAVYLLNKNIAQLQYYTGFSLRDLRSTLHNLRDILYMKPPLPTHMTKSNSGSSNETVMSGPNQNHTVTAGEQQPVSKSRLTVAESVKSASSLESVDNCFLEPPSAKPVEKEPAVSCSLDEGLDNIKEAVKSDVGLQYKSGNNSDPNLRVERSPQVVSTADVASDCAPAKLRTQSECVDPNCDIPKENLPTHNSLDNLFVSVANRTEALASKSGSFNLVRSRPVDKS